MRAQASSRREFLVSVGQGMVVAGLGYTAACELGLSPLRAQEWLQGPERLGFGSRDRLVALVGETPPDRLLPLLVKALREGTQLQDLVAAAALANARAFGGEDYVGFHTFMAMAPAWHMAGELPPERRALPVLKVLYRNANRLAERGAAAGDVLRPVAAAAPSTGTCGAALREAMHRGDMATAEGVFAAATQASLAGGFDDLMGLVHEALDVHRIVLAHRAWDMQALAGTEHAATLLRQSLRYCVKNETNAAQYFGELRTLVPKLLEQHHLLDRAPGTRAVDDAWVERMSQSLFGGTAAAAAEAVAEALADGIAPEAISEAIALAANQLMLRDVGRQGQQVQPGKALGSVHGDSIGIHACDSAHAWRQVARVGSDRNTFASLILAGYQVAHDRVNRGGDFLAWEPRPHAEALAKVTIAEPPRLVSELDVAIGENDQERACALTQRYLELGHAPRALFDLLLDHATRADGALHAEKYYWTTSDEFARSRPAFRNRQLVALARATASQFGTPAPGYAEACRLLGS